MFALDPQSVKYIKSLMTLLAFAMAWIGGSVEGIGWVVELGVMVIGYVIGIVALSQIMRHDVKDLLDWKKGQDEMWKEHNKIHADVTNLLASVKQMQQDSQDRLNRLDDRIERRRSARGLGE